MLAFPFSYVLLPYAAVVAFVALISIINVSHLVRHGATSGVSYVVTMLFFVGSAGILFGTWYALQGTDWTQQITLAVPALSLGAAGLSF